MFGVAGLTARLAVVAAVTGALLAVGCPAAAHAAVYWPNGSIDRLAHANLDGSGADQDFLVTGAVPGGVAVNATHVFWASGTPGTIGRANLDGTQPDPDFITGTSGPAKVAVNATHIYWTNFDGGTIGRANLDGTAVDQSLITATNPSGIALDGSYVYWTSNVAGKIGRAALNGSGPDPDFVATGGSTNGVAVDDSYLYWTNGMAGTIGRSDIDGISVDNAFITGAAAPLGVEVGPAHVYWTTQNPQAIGRANVDGTDINHAFIPGTKPNDVAVDALASPPIAPTPPPLSTTGTEVICNRGPNPGDPSSCGATVGDGGPNFTRPTGLVDFVADDNGTLRNASCTLAAVVSSPTLGFCTVTYVPPAGDGFANVTASYAGDATHLPSSGTTRLLGSGPPAGLEPATTPGTTPGTTPTAPCARTSARQTDACPKPLKLAVIARVQQISGKGAGEKGSLYVQRDGKGPIIPLKVGDPIYENDIVATGDNTRAALKFTIGGAVGLDRTKVAVGERYVTEVSPGIFRTVIKNVGLWAKADKLREPLEIQTNGGVMGIKG